VFLGKPSLSAYRLVKKLTVNTKPTVKPAAYLLKEDRQGFSVALLTQFLE
jgi:hypothetical protein